MVNFKLTIINLHKEFPEMDLDKLVKIIECVVEEYTYTLPNIGNGGIRYFDNTITCSK